MHRFNYFVVGMGFVVAFDGFFKSKWRLECTKVKDRKDAFERKKTRSLMGLNKPKPKRKIQSRGFHKRLRKKMNGTVEVRDASS